MIAGGSPVTNIDDRFTVQFVIYPCPKNAVDGWGSSVLSFYTLASTDRG